LNAPSATITGRVGAQFGSGLSLAQTLAQLKEMRELDRTSRGGQGRPKKKGPRERPGQRLEGSRPSEMSRPNRLSSRHQHARTESGRQGPRPQAAAPRTTPPAMASQVIIDRGRQNPAPITICRESRRRKKKVDGRSRWPRVTQPSGTFQQARVLAVGRPLATSCAVRSGRRKRTAMGASGREPRLRNFAYQQLSARLISIWRRGSGECFMHSGVG